MHRALLIPEILLGIIGHETPENSPLHETPRNLGRASVAVLARTCRAFKELALDALWAELLDLSPLARCLPGACRRLLGNRYTFYKPLTEAERNTLRGYARRVRYIRRFSSDFGSLGVGAKREIFSLMPSAEPLFPRLRSLVWEDFMILPAMHIAVESLIDVRFSYRTLRADIHLVMEFLNAFVERCPDIRMITISSPSTGPLDAAISRHVFQWRNLHSVECINVTLSLDAILHLSDRLTTLRFTLSTDFLSHCGSVIPFRNLTSLEVKCDSVESIVGFFSSIQLPVLEELTVIFPNYVSKEAIEEFNIIVQEACLLKTLIHFAFFSRTEDMIDDATDFDEFDQPQLTLNDLSYAAFSQLRAIHINFAWRVALTDSDLLDLVSAWPQLDTLRINETWGWRTASDDEGISLNGLVQILRRCPFLQYVALAINTETFTHIPDGMDVSFPPRQSLHLKFLDVYIELGSVPGLISVFRALALSTQSFWASIARARDIEEEEE